MNQAAKTLRPGTLRESIAEMRVVQLIGLLLWRGGVLLIVATAVVFALRTVLQLWSLPVQVEVGVLLVLGGAVLVVASLVIERVQDIRAERSEGE